jgi:CheY-like chemotaxis protein
LARKILLADDSVTAQNMGRKILADAGYDVITVNNGSAALKRITEVRPDLIVLDVYMPGYSGLEVCQRIKEASETAHIPVLLTVGKLEPFKPEEARRVRADAHIVKPFEASELLTAITKLEDRMVPQQAEGSRFSSSTGGIERFNGEPSGKKSESSAETDGGWKNRIRFPAKKKKEEEPDPEDIAASAGATFQDFRKGKKGGNGSFGKRSSAEKELAIVPDIPRDITPEELDALSAVAEKLDTQGPAAENVSVGPEESRPSEVAAQFTAPADYAAMIADAQKNLERSQSPEGLPQENQSEQKNDAASGANGVDCPPATVEAVVPAPAIETPTVPVEKKEIEIPPQMKSEPDQPDRVETAASGDQPAFDAAATTANSSEQDTGKVVEAVKRDEQVEEPRVQAGVVADDVKSDELKSDEPAVDVPVVASAEVPSPEVASTEVASAKVVSAEVNEAEAETEAEERTPNEAELAEALRLLTPATGNADANSVSPRWVAENVAVSPEEAKISLEAEMMGISSSTPTTPPADAVASVSETNGDRSIGFSGIAAAVENRLAEAGLGTNHKTWANRHERSAEDAAAEAAAALEASAELLAAASAATPMVEQIGAQVERKLSIERNETESRETDRQRSESNRKEKDTDKDVEHNEPQGSFAEHTPAHEDDSATFADAVSRDRDEKGWTTGRDEASGNEATASAAAIEEENHNSNTEVGGEHSMSNDGKSKSGKSNWREIRTAPTSASQTDLVEAAKQDTSAPENGQKAMAAGAGENSSSGTDSSTIASIVDSVMADLRPRIVEEIAKKLAKK